LHSQGNTVFRIGGFQQFEAGCTQNTPDQDQVIEIVLYIQNTRRHPVFLPDMTIIQPAKINVIRIF
jgi:hypothetical protein